MGIGPRSILGKFLMMGGGANTVTLPQNLIVSLSLFEDFETTVGFSTNSCSIANNTSEYKTGTQSIKMTTTSGGNGRITKTINLSFAGMSRISFYVYIHDALAGYSDITILISSDAFASKYMSQTLNGANLVAGWNLIHMPLNAFSITGGESWSNTMNAMQWRCRATAGNIVNISWDSAYMVLSKPAIMFDFDDGYTVQYNACKYMSNYNIRATLYWSSAFPQLSGAQLVELYNLGHNICPHGNVDLTGLTEAQQETEITANIADLTSIGITRYNAHYAYPAGLWNADTLTAMTNLGMGTGRALIGYGIGTGKRVPYLPIGGGVGMYEVEGWSLLDSASLALAEGYVDATIVQGNILHIIEHELDAAGYWTTTDWNALIDYVRAKCLAGLLNVITVDDYYRLTLGAVSVPKVR